MDEPAVEACEESLGAPAGFVERDRLACAVGGLLSRDDATRGQKATYTLTEAGIQTLPVMVALGAWGLRHWPTTPELAVRARLLAEGSPHLVDELMDELRELHLGVARENPKSPTAPERLQQAYEAAVAIATADSA
ncbi:hypothetical protein [Streptomyces rhizosphaericus]|uniref:hypothetical protein n=1 Tax=Streptomyces rhizosphaericus TaxID=114699 RepID=UPI002892D19D|nr:hypothetical protein [Streptomyces rhizosphaericus]